jgi:hypothetical protein
MCSKNRIKEKTISTLDELLGLIDEYSGKKLYFRGENINHGETACLPQIFRKNSCHDINSVGDRDNLWFAEKLECLGVGTPYRPPKSDSDSDGDIIMNALLNNHPHCWSLWGEDKLEALIQHYAFDFDNLKDIIKTNLEFLEASFIQRFLDITSDITVALHFACSRFLFKLKNENISSETKTIEDGYIFVFDLSGIESSKYLKLVFYPSYTYFYKNGEEFHFQPFDRITHQKGSFLAPQNDEKGIIERRIFEKEIKEHISEKIILKSDVKKELYRIFGSKKGFDYYFPKIPLTSPRNMDIAEAYNNDIEGITILE